MSAVNKAKQYIDENYMKELTLDDVSRVVNISSYYFSKVFKEETGENFIDYHDCENWFKQLIEKYHIYPLKTGYDRYSASYLVQDLQQYGMHMDDVYQGENLYGVIQETQGLLEDGKINIGDNDLLK